MFSLLAIAAFVYRSWSGKPASVSPAVNISTPIAASQPVAKPQLETLAQAVPAKPAKADKVAPINERWGQMQPSNDLIVALMDHQDLALTKDEMEKLLTVYLEVGRERSYYEASIATVKVISPTERIITIPAYPQEGVKLQASLYDKFSEALGESRGAQVQAALAPTLYARNYGFGETEQQVKVRLLEGEPISFYFVHSTGTLHVPYEGDFLTVKYGGMDSTHLIDDLGSYVGFMKLLPGGGS